MLKSKVLQKVASLSCSVMEASAVLCTGALRRGQTDSSVLKTKNQEERENLKKCYLSVTEMPSPVYLLTIGPEGTGLGK